MYYNDEVILEISVIQEDGDEDFHYLALTSINYTKAGDRITLDDGEVLPYSWVEDELEAVRKRGQEMVDAGFATRCYIDSRAFIPREEYL